MHGHGMCADGYCGPMSWSKKDRMAMLEEQEKIMEAKLATLKHMKESLASEKDSDKE